MKIARAQTRIAFEMMDEFISGLPTLLIPLDELNESSRQSCRYAEVNVQLASDESKSWFRSSIVPPEYRNA